MTLVQCFMMIDSHNVDLPGRRNVGRGAINSTAPVAQVIRLKATRSESSDAWLNHYSVSRRDLFHVLAPVLGAPPHFPAGGHQANFSRLNCNLTAAFWHYK